MSDQPPPGRHTLSEAQHLMGRLRAAKRGGAQMPTGDMSRLADLLTNDIRQLQGDLAQVESALRYTQAQVGMYRTMLDGQKKLDRQIEKATPPKQPTKDGPTWDGSTDDTAAIQKLIDEAAEGKP